MNEEPRTSPWFRWLLVLAAGTLFLLPILVVHPIALRSASIAISVAVVGVVISATPRPALIAAAIALAVAHQATNLIPGLESLAFRLGGLLANVALMAVCSAVIVLTVWREKDVTIDTILGGIAVYLLLGAIWGGVYSVIAVLEPSSFAIAGSLEVEGSSLVFQEGRFPRLLYFSYVTLTTLGYGDVTPASGLTEGLAVAEAIMGQLFIAVFIARIVGVYIAQRLQR